MQRQGTENCENAKQKDIFPRTKNIYRISFYSTQIVWNDFKRSKRFVWKSVEREGMVFIIKWFSNNYLNFYARIVCKHDVLVFDSEVTLTSFRFKFESARFVVVVSRRLIEFLCFWWYSDKRARSHHDERKPVHRKSEIKCWSVLFKGLKRHTYSII